MKTFKDKVAVLTGAASGIGRGLADRCAQEGMKVVLADIEEKALVEAEREMKSAGADVLAVRTDVASLVDIEALAQKTLDAYGGVHLLFNNAGVGVARDLLDSTAADWKWIMGVNLWGVINGIRVFLPIMLSRDTEGHIVNTASAGVWMNTGGSGIYKVSKRGMIGLTHALYHALADRDAKIGVSLLYPGHVQSRIHLEPERNRPELVRRDPVQARLRERDTRMVKEVLGDRVGMSPAEVAEIVFNAIRESRFYILTHPRWKILAQLQMEELLLERNPVHLRPTEPAKIKRATLRVLFRDLIPWPGWGYLFARGARRGRPRTQERKGYIAR